MSAEEPQPANSTVADEDATMVSSTPAPPTAPAAMSSGNRKRPRLDLTGTEDKADRKRKSILGVMLGTLNQAKVENRERSKGEAAKRRQLTEQRLQDRLRKETDSVRRAEELKKDKTTANRKEEELQLKDSIHKLRRTRLPLLANFLSTADEIPPVPASDDIADDTQPSQTKDPLAPLSKSHPPPLYYLPAILTPAQEAFLKKRKAEVVAAAETEWTAFREERAAGVAEILKLRERVAEEDAKKKAEQHKEPNENGEDVRMGDEDGANGTADSSKEPKKEEAGMDVDAETKSAPTPAPKSEEQPAKTETKITPQIKRDPIPADEDDAVEY